MNNMTSGNISRAYIGGMNNTGYILRGLLEKEIRELREIII